MAVRKFDDIKIENEKKNIKVKYDFENKDIDSSLFKFENDIKSTVD